MYTTDTANKNVHLYKYELNLAVESYSGKIKMPKRPALENDDRGGHVGDGQNATKKRHIEESSPAKAPSQQAEAGINGRADQRHAGIVLPRLVDVTPWVSSEIPTELPPLPKILDSTLEEAVFTHPGLSANNYERLEWLGDAYLELIASALIYQTFQDTASGRCSQFREMLIRNTTLAGYFREYGLTTKAALPESLGKDRALGRGRSSDKDPLKTQGDMFEAYVAAAITSDPNNGLANTTAWLKALFGRTIRDHIIANEKKQLNTSERETLRTDTRENNFSAKEQLRLAIGAKGINLRYVDVPGNRQDRDLKLPLYSVGVYLDGWGEMNKLLGTGTALGKKEAGQKAAKMALENKKLIKVYEAKKKAFNEAMEA